MTRLIPIQTGWRATLRHGMAAVMILAFASTIALAENAKPEKPAKAEKAKKAEPKKPSGADLYSMHCNRCHPERYATERTAKEWKTLMTHMRIRANLPAEQAKSILKYLQEDSGK